MEKIPQSQEDKLLDYLDGKLSPTEVQKLEMQIESNEGLKSRLEELRSVHHSLHLFKLEQPSKNFTQRVMEGLDQYPLRKGLSIRNSIFLLAGVLVAVSIAALLASAGVFDGMSTTINLNQLDLSKQYVQDPLPSFSLNGKLLVNIIIFLNVAIALIVLDRAVLKPFFQKRMETGH